MTEPSMDQLRGPAGQTSPVVAVLLPSRGIVFAQLDLITLVLDTSGAIPVLKAPETAIAKRNVDVVTVAAAIPAYTTKAPIVLGEVDVYRNGVCQSEGEDYSVSGNVISFVAASEPQAGDLLRVVYR